MWGLRQNVEMKGFGRQPKQFELPQWAHNVLNREIALLIGNESA